MVVNERYIRGTICDIILDGYSLPCINVRSDYLCDDGTHDFWVVSLAEREKALRLRVGDYVLLRCYGDDEPGPGHTIGYIEKSETPITIVI